MSLLTLDQLLHQIQIGAERRCLDFKEDIDLVNGDRKTKVNATKDIIALANAGGGYLVLGVSERKPDRVEIVGMSDPHLDRFDATPINGFVSNYARPAINAICRKVKVGDATLGVIEVPGLLTTPHVVVKDYENILHAGDILMRSAHNASERATPEDLDQMFGICLQNRRDLVRSIVQAGQAAHDSMEHQLAVRRGRPLANPRFDVDRHLTNHVAFFLATVFWAWGQDTPEIPPRDLHRYIDECAIRTANFSGFYFPPGYSGDRANEERRAGELIFTGPIGYIGGYGYTALTTEHWATMAESIYPRGAFPGLNLPDGVAPLLLEQIIKFVLGGVVFARRLQAKSNTKQSPKIEIQLISSKPLQVIAPELSVGLLLGVRNIKPNPMAEPISVDTLVKGVLNKDELFDVAAHLAQDILWRLYLDLEPTVVKQLVAKYAEKMDLSQESATNP